MSPGAGNSPSGGGTGWEPGRRVGALALAIAVLGVTVLGAHAAAAQSTAPADPGNCSTVPGDHLVAGCLDASAADASGRTAVGNYTLSGPAEAVVITLDGPSGADFDLYATLDGREPTQSDSDRKSRRPGSTERIVVDGEELTRRTTIGVAVYAYEGSGEFHVDVERVVPLEARIAGPNATRPGERVTFDAGESVAPVSATYAWRVDGELVDRGRQLRHEFSDPGTHEVSLTVESSNRSDTVTRTVDVGSEADGAEPTVRARANVLSPEPVWVGDTVRFTADRSVATGTAIEAYEWSFGDGQSATGETVAREFEEPGTYEVTLTVRTDSDATATVRTSLEVRRPSVRITDVEGSTTSFVPDVLFAGCTDPIRVRTRGTEPVERVRFSVGDGGVVDSNGSDGWSVPKQRLGEGDAVEITAVGANGTTDTETVALQTAPSPSGVRVLSDLINKFADAADSNVQWAPISVSECSYTVYYPQITSNVSAIPEVGGDNFQLPDKLARFMPAGENIFLTGEFTLTYRPEREVVSLGGGARARIYLNPSGETRVQGNASITGDFALPEWDLTGQRISGYIGTRVYLEEYVSPVPIPKFRIKIDNPSPVGPDHVVNESIDPIDVWVEPGIELRGSINEQFELSSLELRGRGRFTVHGQVGDRCHFNAGGFGCVGVRKWVEGFLESDSMGILPFEPRLGGRAGVESGYQIRTPSNLLPDRKKAWTLSWDLPTPASRIAPGSTAPAPGERAHAGVDTTPGPVVDVETTVGHSSKRTGSPGQSLMDRSDEPRRVTPTGTLGVRPR